MQPSWVYGLVLLLSGCSVSERASYQGYAEGDYVYISSSQAGRLDQLWVKRGQQVLAKVPLFALDAEKEMAAQNQAQQQVEAAHSQWQDLQSGKRAPEIAVIAEQLIQARATAHDALRQKNRISQLYAEHAVSQVQLDEALAAAESSAARVRELQNQQQVAALPARDQQLKAAKAQWSAAVAALQQARWLVEQKSVAAPKSALVVDTLYREGEWIKAGAPVVKLLPPEQIKLRFFVPESALSQFKLGQKIKATCDQCAAPVQAKVDFISALAEYTPPVIYSEQTRSKLVYRLEAVLENPKALHPGQPVTVTP
ncbi:HlyD family secretion protein [Iodobacter fluviatilis]|uniref:HlyD family secretion protein n=1 Tax=Iodobacter fluviatilis TaxID=537 RepID=A0A377Q3A5_9NEIS|nr:HlyD family efflux transporter periplasmic adaptor subunit [Iodobacter fluviatilis]TCU84081.1 HlyD family secretion protein [Iodobacter fluviatilis]STQ89694.1 putative efflux pump membrane fusion protein [Iodobacter fluviatilis]